MTLLDILPSLRGAMRPRIDTTIWPLTTQVDALGRLCVGSVALTDVADEFGTPAYVLDEADFRKRAQHYRATLRGVEVVYAAQSLLTRTVAGWVHEAGLGMAVCSTAELATALAGGMDPARIVVHGSGKSVDELATAAGAGVGRIVLDCPIEMAYLAGVARRRQAVLLQVRPGVDVLPTVRRALATPQLPLAGLYCHLGMQIAEPEVYVEAVRGLVNTMTDVRAAHGVVLTELNIGGGHAIAYRTGEPELDVAALADFLEDALDAACAANRFPRPRLVVEPGRAISGRAGVTLHRVQSVSARTDGRAVVTVDGSHPHSAPVANYTVALANRHPLGLTRPATVVGRDGTVIADDLDLPDDVHPGDLLATACTGAYHHSTASNFTMTTRPPVIAVCDRRVRPLIRRETTADLLLRDCG
ncbi:diaminopimelate decarboxylase family protein [Mycolicibacterium mucogenicum]|uniref:Diaminopimelate decarboxylase n=1 Tax=Mycolicibacterium mucogenicum TaxID=56689 RepID=A0A1A0MM25_MYCMU|nr:diaminopimelate decarboxylase [Mycolicibacterium mucogenicum]OBA85813.1 diaminopimelate decarboxylase [Mycolicibacterium mucogenicum]TDK85533.1 diaminopimelate decarboxylase [Mycolicibacterium mucogenicum]